ncbi:hypothetical protein [Candidatus Methylacidiphilum fumarolicum]|uniref:hypothetical protein n=1 Tax=Candidatus Methylacidiphilum fumarolicum TaxID=591154 RepID=UPI00106C13AF|nr:hypothetical protein [Candidatus Methylacidiphilum fumarolicum]
MGLLPLLYQIVYLLAIFPLADPLVMIAPAGAATNAIRIVCKYGLNSMIQAEVHDLTDALDGAGRDACVYNAVCTSLWLVRACAIAGCPSCIGTAFSGFRKVACWTTA